MRAAHGGTVIYQNGRLEKVNTKTQQTISAGVYPAWHPNGKMIAFSNNHIIQTFHSIPSKKIEVIDTLSDIMVYNTQNQQVSNCLAIASADRLETFPWWSSDGKFLYYCSAKAFSPKDYQNIRYDLLRIAFDEQHCSFGKVDTVVKASALGKSISFPRISPDGKYLLFCMSNYGNFSIWHRESDLYLLDLSTNQLTKPDINSLQTESYHTWSSTGRWIVFSSRRIDGLYTRPYFSYFDRNGKAHKPFLLPQKKAFFYDTFLKSYNIPELVTTKVDLNPRSFREIVERDPIKATFAD